MTEIEAYEIAISCILDDKEYSTTDKVSALEWMYRALSYAKRRAEKEDVA